MSLIGLLVGGEDDSEVVVWAELVELERVTNATGEDTLWDNLGLSINHNFIFYIALCL